MGPQAKTLIFYMSSIGPHSEEADNYIDKDEEAFDELDVNNTFANDHDIKALIDTLKSDSAQREALNNSTFERQCKFSESLDKKEEEESMSDNHEYINSGLFNNQ